MLAKNRRLVFGALSLLIILIAAFVFLRYTGPKQNAQAGQTYVDPRYGFTVQVPAGWTVIPRPGDDDPRVKNAVLTFKSPEGQASDGQIVIGLRSRPYDPAQPLDEWTQREVEAGTVFEPEEVKTIKEEYITLRTAGNVKAYYVHGQSPLTEYQFVNIPQGNSVWFVWTDMGKERTDLFLQVVKSFTFGEEPIQ